MALPNGLYFLILPQYKDEKYDDEKNTKYLGAVHVGEIPDGYCQSCVATLLERLDERYGKQKPVRPDFCYHDRNGKSIYPENLTEKGLAYLVLKGKTKSHEHREVLDIAESVAEDIRQSFVTSDKQNPDLTDITSPPLMMIQAAIEKAAATMEDSVFRGTYRSMARFREPEIEIEDEKVERLVKEGWKWKEAIKATFFVDIPDDEISDEKLDLKVDEVRQRIKRDRKGKV